MNCRKRCMNCRIGGYAVFFLHKLMIFTYPAIHPANLSIHAQNICLGIYGTIILCRYKKANCYAIEAYLRSTYYIHPRS